MLKVKVKSLNKLKEGVRNLTTRHES